MKDIKAMVNLLLFSWKKFRLDNLLYDHEVLKIFRVEELFQAINPRLQFL